jgi:hypothetical protein
VREECRVAAVLRPQIGAEKVGWLMEFLYAQREHAPVDKLAALDRNPHPAELVRCPFTLSDGTVGYIAGHEVICGHNPHLRARLVDNLRLCDADQPDAGLVWTERQRPEHKPQEHPAKRVMRTRGALRLVSGVEQERRM